MCGFDADGREEYTVAVLCLGDEACHADDLVRGKAATLSRLASEFSIPAGFAVPVVSPAIDESQAAAVGEDVARTADALRHDLCDALPAPAKSRTASSRHAGAYARRVLPTVSGLLFAGEVPAIRCLEGVWAVHLVGTSSRYI